MYLPRFILAKTFSSHRRWKNSYLFSKTEKLGLPSADLENKRYNTCGLGFLLSSSVKQVCVFFFCFRVCVIKSVDSSNVTGFCVHECEGSNRMGSRPRRYLFTGHSNGAIQVCLTYILVSLTKDKVCQRISL